MSLQVPPSTRPLLTCLIACVTLLHTPAIAAQTWREIRSPHFRVLTEGSDKDGRDVAKEFEQMRSVFAARFNNATLETGAPLLVLAVRENGLKALSPALWKERDRVAGEFFHGWERQFALVRLDSFGDLNQAVVFHEYTHSIFHANLHWLPTWLDEGLAEFYAYTRFQGDHIYIGAASIRMQHLRSVTMIPISKILASDSATYSKDGEQNDLFYAESWAMVHFMNFGPEMGNGAKLNQFIKLLESGTPQPQAFREVFGEPRVFEDKLANYISKLSIPAAVFPPAEQIDAKSYPSRVLTQPEANYELGSFDIGLHDFPEGRKRIQAAEAADPALPGPHEESGFLLWNEGKDEAAKAEWQTALTADPARYRCAFALLMSATPLKQQTPQQLQQTQQALEAIKAQAPKYAPVYAELALTLWRLGQIKQAYQAALAAEKLEPWRAGYHLLTAQILVRGNQPKLAGEYARMVAARWPGADHDEAVDLWNQLPPAARGDGPALTPETPSDATLLRGTIVSTSCDKTGLTVVLQPDASASPLTLIAAGPYQSGFSDSLWFGEDHFTSCFHLAGLPAVVAYKATSSGARRLLQFEIRDDLPDQTPAPTPAKTTAITPQPAPAHAVN